MTILFIYVDLFKQLLEFTNSDLSYLSISFPAPPF